MTEPLGEKAGENWGPINPTTACTRPDVPTTAPCSEVDSDIPTAFSAASSSAAVVSDETDRTAAARDAIVPSVWLVVRQCPISSVAPYPRTKDSGKAASAAT